MSLPDFSQSGDLLEGVHRASIDEFIRRFGGGTRRRKSTGETLMRILRLVQATGKLQRFIIFGSFVTDKPEPNDIDIILVMRDDFNVTACVEPTKFIFDHAQAAARFSASIFWIRPAMLLLESEESFVQHWQITRDRGRRGIVEVAYDQK